MCNQDPRLVASRCWSIYPVRLDRAMPGIPELRALPPEQTSLSEMPLPKQCAYRVVQMGASCLRSLHPYAKHKDKMVRKSSLT